MRRLPPGGGVIRAQRPRSDARAARLDLAVLDETACTRTSGARPSGPGRPARRTLFSARRAKQLVWSLWMHGQTAAHEQWKSWRFPTTANPLIDPAEVQAARDQLGAHLPRIPGRVPGRRQRVPPRGRRRPPARRWPGARRDYVFGVDWARDADFTCIAVLAVGARRWWRWTASTRSAGACSAGGWRRWPATGRPRRSGPKPTASAGRIRGCSTRACRDRRPPPAARPLIRRWPGAGARRAGDLPDPALVGELQAYRLERLPPRFRYGAPRRARRLRDRALACWHGASGGDRSVSSRRRTTP